MQVGLNTRRTDDPPRGVSGLKVLISFAGWWLTIFQAVPIQAQNLVPNPSFETLSECPSYWGGVGMSFAPPWESAHSGTPDIFHECATFPGVDVPDNFLGTEYAHSGQGYSGMFTFLSGYEYREYLRAPLSQSLVAGSWYNVSMWVSTPEEACGVNSFGIYFTDDWLWEFNIEALPLHPQIVATSTINETNGWVEVNACFQANGGEQIMIIGNFNDDPNTIVDPGCPYTVAYYYVDDVSVSLVPMPDEIPFDLGDPVTACYSYIIDPGLSDYYYTWSDSSHLPTLEVFESGTYALTITDGQCNYGIDSIEVTIANTLDPIDIGPATLTICQGESYDIALDPTLSTYTWQDGTTGSDYSITETGTYAVTLDDGCNEESDQIEVTVLEPPTPVELGENSFLCEGDQITWVLDPTQGDYVWQDGTTGAVYTATTGGFYSVTVVNMCGMSSDEILLTDLDIPEPDLGFDELILCDGENMLLSLDPELGTFTWQDGSHLSTFNVLSTGTYSVSVTNECGTGEDEIYVEFMGPPEVNLGPDTFLCTGTSILLTANPEATTYTWQDQSSDPTFLVTSGGTFAVTVENNCGSSAAEIYIEQIDSVTAPDLGTNISLCPGEEITLHASNPGASYLWHDFSTLDSFVVTGPGTYSVQVFNACNIVMASVDVFLNDTPPQIDLPDTLRLCEGSHVTLDPGINGVSYLWNDQSEAPTLQISTPGTYSLTVSNTCGSDQDSVLVLSGGFAPMVDLGTDIQFCQGDHTEVWPTTAHVVSWMWQDGSTDTSFIVTTEDTLILQVANACGTATDTLYTQLLPPIPVLSLGTDTAVCPGQAVTFTIPNIGVNIEWGDGSTGSDFTIQQPGIVTASISNQCGVAADTVMVIGLPPAPVADLGPDQSLCAGEIIIVAPGMADATYLWQDGSFNDTFIATHQQTIILTLSNVCGTDTDTLNIIENNQGPQIDLGPDISVCEGVSVTVPSGILGVQYSWQDGSSGASFTTTVSDTVILEVTNMCGTDTDTIVVNISGTPPYFDLGADIVDCAGNTLWLDPGVPNTMLTWQDGSTNDVYQVTTSGEYYVEAVNTCGVFADTIHIDFSGMAPELDLGANTTVCEGTVMTLSPGLSDVDYLWQDGSSDEVFVVTQAGIYFLTASNTCGSASDTITVSYQEAPDPFSLGPDTILCPGETMLLSSPSIFYDVMWQDGSGMLHLVVNHAGLYALTLSNACGTASDEINIDYDTQIPQIDIDPLLYWCEEDVITLDAAQSFEANYLWNTGETSSSITIATPGLYQVEVATFCGSKSFDIAVEEDPQCGQMDEEAKIYIPNIFSPNGDGINDTFTLGYSSGINVISVSGKIYDRWGNLVFGSEASSFAWDGTFSDEVMMPGVYVFVLRVEFEVNGQTQVEVFKGDVTLVR